MALIRDISAAGQEQSSAIAQVSTAVRQMDEMTQHNAALVEETNAAIEQTEGQANELDRIVDVFVLGTNQETSPTQSSEGKKVRPKGAAALQQKVKAAAASYLNAGNTALEKDWAEF